MIPEKLLSEFEIINVEKDQNGRAIILDCKVSGSPFIIVNVYFPTKDNPVQQLEFFNYLKSIINEYIGSNLLVGGDFNICLNLKKDKKGGKQEKESQYAKELKCYMEQVDLIDIWRKRHPNLLHYSRREVSRSGLVQSRIDFWLVSAALEYQIDSANIKPGNNSDHSIISINVELLETQKRGKGFWKFNNDLLTDQNYIEIIRKTIGDIKQNDVMEDKSQFWVYVKCRIRSETIGYCIQRT